MKNLITIHIKHLLRNNSREVPIGLTGLGKWGMILSSPISELIAFIGLMILPLIVLIGYIIETRSFSVYYGINPTMVIMIIVGGFLYVDSYSENFQSKFNKKCLTVFPISFQKKYYSFCLVELISTKLLIFVILGISILGHNYFTPFINLKQTFNLYLFVIFNYIIYNNFILIVKLFWGTQSKTKSYLIIYSIFPILFVLGWKSDLIFYIVENYFLWSLLFSVSLVILINYFGYSIFKKIMQSGYLFRE